MWGNMNKSSKGCAMFYMRKFVKGLSRFTLKRPNLSDNKTHSWFWKHYSIKIQAFEITKKDQKPGRYRIRNINLIKSELTKILYYDI